MDYAAAADALMRRKLLEQMYDRMTDEEKRLFVMMTMQNRSNDMTIPAVNGCGASQLSQPCAPFGF